MAAFILLNGYPGVGKLTIARKLCQLIPHAKVLDNHLQIDPVAAIHDRGAPEYQTLRKAMRQLLLNSITTSPSTKTVTWIFTEQQSSSPGGTEAILDYVNAAKKQGVPLVSVVLSCSEEENMSRALAHGRGSTGFNTKLTDLAILKRIRDTEDIFRVGDGLELDLDVTGVHADDAASAIIKHLENVRSGDYSRYIILDRPTSLANQNPVLSATSNTDLTFELIPGFKHKFISDFQHDSLGRDVTALCWLMSKIRYHGKIAFLDVVDSTGNIQVFASATHTRGWEYLRGSLPETSLRVEGKLCLNEGGTMEISASAIDVVSKATKILSPEVRRTSKDVLSSRLSNLILSNRHIYLRNPLLFAINKFRSHLFYAIRTWFEERNFIDFSTPLITPSILYEPSGAIKLSNLKGTKTIYLSQCAGFYLEAGAHAHERVYNLGPSFRNESRTNRHLMEYWHIKAELCSGTLDDIISLVEVFLRDIFDVTSAMRHETLIALQQAPVGYFKIPVPRISYRNAIVFLNSQGVDIGFGQNIPKDCEDRLTRHHRGPVWITHKPRNLEPFPYTVCPDDDELTMTADLIAPGGFGEICGVAEKSFKLEDLDMRLREKGKENMVEEYGWVRELREVGLVPHTAFGMGFERVLRWFCQVPHVKDTIPFPRIFERHPLP